jgi:hypothetical protein
MACRGTRLTLSSLPQSHYCHTGEVKQVVVPEKFLAMVMKLAYESIVGGHLPAKKTADHITSNFHWPGVISDVTRFYRSCDLWDASQYIIDLNI